MTDFASNASTKEPLYCAEQIRIPADLPDILKNYTKHIIKTQPSDILGSSAEYFGRLAKQRTQAGKKVTNMQLEGFYQKFANLERPTVHKKEIEEACVHLSITISQFNDIINLGGWQGEKIPWVKFWGLLVASSAGTLIATIETTGILLNDNGSIPTQPVLEVLNLLSERDSDIDKSRVNAISKGLQNAGSKISMDSLMELLRKPSTPPAQATEESSNPAQEEFPLPDASEQEGAGDERAVAEESAE
ncbi:Ropporin-1-like protein [Phlyctochytrium planicorne]|nr:Ropporin-1-like protein [Phlyctochytrium planicorne]